MSPGDKVRVALLTEIMSPYRIAAFNSLAADPRIDLDVLFFAETEDRRSWQVPPASRMRFRHFVVPGWVVGRRYQAGSLFLNPRIVSYLRRGKYGAVITGGYHHPTIWLALVYCGLRGRRVLSWSESTARDARSGGRMSERVKRALIRRFDGFIAAGAAQREYLVSLGAPRDRIWVAPDSVDVEFFSQAIALRAASARQVKTDLGVEGPIVLYVGRLLDAKGIPELIDAFAHVGANGGATLLIVGHGPDRSRYEDECRRRGLAGVKFAGFVQPDDLLPYYAAADIFVFPTRSDPWGLAINEAMAAGLPVVASAAAGAVDDLVQPGETGFVHPPGDSAALARHLATLLGDASLRRRMGDRARSRMNAYTPELMAQGMVEAVLALPNAAYG